MYECSFINISLPKIHCSSLCDFNRLWFGLLPGQGDSARKNHRKGSTGRACSHADENRDRHPVRAKGHSDVDIRIPKQQLTVSVNGQRQLIHKADTEKYIFDENKLQLEQTSKASLDIKIPTVNKTRRWSIGIGASRNGVAYMLRGPLKGHVGLWVVGDKKTVMGGVSFDF